MREVTYDQLMEEGYFQEDNGHWEVGDRLAYVYKTTHKILGGTSYVIDGIFDDKLKVRFAGGAGWEHAKRDPGSQFYYLRKTKVTDYKQDQEADEQGDLL